MNSEKRHGRTSEGVYWTATVYDEVKGQKFKLKVIGDKVHVYPQSEDFGLGTFSRFVEFVQENIDPYAEVVVNDE